MFLPDDEPTHEVRPVRSKAKASSKPRADDCFRPFDFPDMPKPPSGTQFTAVGFKRTTTKE